VEITFHATIPTIPIIPKRMAENVIASFTEIFSEEEEEEREGEVGDGDDADDNEEKDKDSENVPEGSLSELIVATSTPVDPVVPVDSVVSVDPVVPVCPVDPVVPVCPVDPVVPVCPVDPISEMLVYFHRSLRCPVFFFFFG
jgi:hypothetical protein